MRLLTIADQSLTAARSNMDGFISVLRTVTDPAAKSAQGGRELASALSHAEDAVAAVTAARTGVDGLEGVAASLKALDDTTTGVRELRDQVSRLLDSGGKGEMKVNPLGVQAQVEEVRGSVATTKDALQRASNPDEIAEAGTFTEIATETKAAGHADILDDTVDDVTTRAAQLTTEIGRMPTLEEVGLDMVAAARRGKYENLVGREPEVDQILTIVQRSRKPNPVLLGDAGVGKTQIVEGLAVRIAKGEVPESMRNVKLYSIDAASLKAAAGPEKGALEKLVKDIVDEVAAERERGEKVVLFMDEMHTLMNADDTAQQLKPALARGDISLIGATTWEEYNKFIAKDGALVRRVAPVSIDELNDSQVLDVLRSVQEGLSRHHDTVAFDSAIQEVQRISSRYVKDRRQPDPAIELLDHALSRVANGWRSGMPPHIEEMSNTVGRLKATIPMLEHQHVIGDIGIIDEAGTAGKLVSARNQLADLEPKLDAALQQLDREREVLGTRNDLVKKYLSLVDEGTAEAAASAEALRPQIDEANLAVRQLREQYPERLLNDMLDVTAVREAASNLYGRTISAGGADEAQRALRLGDDLAAKVIGQRQATDKIAEAMIGIKSGMKDPDAPAGAFLFMGPTGVGKTQTIRVVTRTMTDDVDNMVRFDMGEFSEPHSVSRLFGSPPGYVGYDDAPGLAALIKNPEAHLLFDEVEKAHPQVFQKLLALIEEGRATLGNGQKVDARGATIYMTTNLPAEATAGKPGLRDFFSPEFLNRLDAVVEFNHLDRQAVGQILDLELPEVLGRSLENGLDISVTDAAKSRIIDYGFDSAMGARPLNRSIKNHVTNPSGRMILELQAAGRNLDAGTPQKAVLDIAQDGEGFVMRSVDGEISVPIAARKAEDHAPGASRATHQAAAASTPPVRAEDELLDWNPGFSRNDAGSAITPPASEPATNIVGGD
ncbi:MAG: ATP-dependent Clp protease ATP-binding subunit [Thermoleophilia bacterium]|nr:ATP-dependent Clp protease ATP-binding subunit [Thermoleophilia bacterium]